MNGKCARCQKTVYQVEELKCLDKIWHKSCFRCTTCGMALTLKNYKGFNRMPYCVAHAPKVQATSVASTPEMKRLTNNTRLQSNAKYHEEYEREKKTHNQGRSDETSSVNSRQSAKMDSNVAYRVCKIEHKNIVERRKRELDIISRQSSSNKSVSTKPNSSKARPLFTNLHEGKPRRNLLASASSGVSKKTTKSDEVKLAFKSTTFNDALTNSSNSFSSIDSDDTVTSEVKKPHKRLIAGNGQHTGIEEIIPRHNSEKENLSFSSVVLSEEDSDNTIPELVSKISNVTLTIKASKALSRGFNMYKKKEELEEVINFDQLSSKTEIIGPQSKVEPAGPSTSLESSPARNEKAVRRYRALFDFQAKEDDEASFKEDDIIVEVEKENYGWITGRVVRTGKIGLIPANYLERCKTESQLKLERKLAELGARKFIVHPQDSSEESEETKDYREVLIN